MTSPTSDVPHPPASEPVIHHVHLPEPTAWPFLMALGLTLLLGSLVMNYAITILGIVLTLLGAVGWFRDVLPTEKVENIEVLAEPANIPPVHTGVRRIEVNETHRAQLPLRTFSIWSGVKGGIAGGIVMVIPAELYGIARYHSIWYVVNLLGGAGVGNWLAPTQDQLMHFRLSAFITANVIQGVATLLVGLLYGALLPIWPKRPILLGGLVAPLLWTGLLHSILKSVNPYLAARIDWYSFAAAQVVYGVVAGFVVSRVGELHLLRQAPLAVRLGVETPGLMREPDRKEGEQ